MKQYTITIEYANTSSLVYSHVQQNIQSVLHDLDTNGVVPIELSDDIRDKVHNEPITRIIINYKG